MVGLRAVTARGLKPSGRKAKNNPTSLDETNDQSPMFSGFHPPKKEERIVCFFLKCACVFSARIFYSTSGRTLIL